MSWKTIMFESIDLRDGMVHEVHITELEMIETENLDDKGKKKKAHLYKGYEKKRGPVKFICTDTLAEQMGVKAAVGNMFLIQWRGKVPLKAGRTMNVFGCQQWEGDLPEWTKGGDFGATGEVEVDDFPDVDDENTAAAQAAEEAKEKK